MRVFLSYPSDQKRVADEISLALGQQGCHVFFDRTELPSGAAFDEAIHRELMGSDLMVFLITPKAVKRGQYTLTELKFARKKWPSPDGRVLPVMITPTDLESIPAYLTAVTIEEPAGNVSAEVAARVREMRASTVPVKSGVVSLEDVVRWALEMTRLTGLPSAEMFQFRMKEVESRSVDSRLPILSLGQTWIQLGQLAERLDVTLDESSQSLPKSFESEFAVGEEDGLLAVGDALNKLAESTLASVVTQLTQRDARTRQAFFVGAHIGYVEVEIMVSAANLALSDAISVDEVFSGPFDVWRATRRADKLNKAAMHSHLQARLVQAEDAAEQLSVPRGWTKELGRAARKLIGVTMDRRRRRLVRSVAAEQFLEALWNTRVTIAKEMDRLLIRLN